MGMFLVVYLTKWVSLYTVYMQQLSGWLGASVCMRNVPQLNTHSSFSIPLHRCSQEEAGFSEDGEKAES